MASTGYPKVTTKAWRTLRARAAAAPSTKFTPSTVAALLGMSSPTSARDNTVAPMRRLGLLDEEGALTPRGNKWRADGSYAEACEEIIKHVYPADLAALADESGEPNADAVRKWFDHKGFGDSNARQMAATYVMIARKSPPEPAGATANKAPSNKVAPRKQRAATPRAIPTVATPASAERAVEGSGSAPNVHLDIQIHIPADASAEQIDQIFESMARHLYKQ